MNVYIQLADYIDSMHKNPYHKKHDENRPFVKIFRRLLTEEQAQAALLLGADPIGVEAFAKKAGMDPETARKLLFNLAKKGVAFVDNNGGEDIYSLLPFCPGIMESLYSEYLDDEISRYLQEYVDELNDFIYGGERTIVMNTPVEAKIYHSSFEEAMYYLKKGSVFSLSDCLCRTAKEKLGQACGHTIKDVCIQVGPLSKYYVRTGRAHYVSFEEAVQVLERSREEGLYFEISHAMSGDDSYFICSCCPCCCIAMRTVLPGSIRREEPASKYLAQIDVALCTGCGHCEAECPAKAIGAAEGSWQVNGARCIGCGLCCIYCKNGAISIVER
ncbi:MAG: 4Fe-4S binding protein [Firmicutes bacterium]|jgi:NAD-dependent dihydropyrimidine dehydrogenase PreA subunit|nr:4Fe-4S binding protein [Bacillota bacterium]